MTSTPARTRRAGILVPLFSLWSADSWGIGEIHDILPMVSWLERAGMRLLQLLPISAMPPAETSPYSAESAMALSPQFISMHAVEDVVAIGGERGLPDNERRTLDSVRASATIRYREVRSLKDAVLRRAFAAFRDREWRTGSARARSLRRYLHEERWWLDDYTLFRALHSAYEERAWIDWPESLARRDPAALDRARTEHRDEILYTAWLQWIAAGQWADVRRRAGPMQLFGDLPFMVGLDSADVWTRQDAFRLDVSVGVPPDAFSASGQDWGLPLYQWDVFRDRDFDWLRERARRNAALFDGYRIDHLVGFYRTYFRPKDGSAPAFSPADEPEQIALGERVLTVFLESGAEIVAEDLGIVPDFVRASLARLGIPGYRVMRWERAWGEPGQPFLDPIAYPAISVATSGTHDTEPLATWWVDAATDERAAVLRIPAVREQFADEDLRAVADGSYTDRVRDALLETLVASGSDVLILPIQDVFGWTDRINQPATSSDANWTWRLPWPVDRLTTEPLAAERAKILRSWTERYGRSAAGRRRATLHPTR